MAPLADLAAPFVDKWQSINPHHPPVDHVPHHPNHKRLDKAQVRPQARAREKRRGQGGDGPTAFDAAIADAKAAGAVAVVDFTASWCGPCKRIAPHFAKMSLKYGDVRFSRLTSIARKTSRPRLASGGIATFMFFKGARRWATPSRART